MIELHAFDTPNGRKISVALEEMALPYTIRIVDISKGEQFRPDFLAISPNAKIPAIVDTDGPNGTPVSVFESGAILIYLGEKTGNFWPKDLEKRIPVLEWLMFQHGGFGPIPGQVHHFAAMQNEQDRRYGLERYPWIDAVNLGAQVPCERLVREAQERGADAILVSQVVTQKQVHARQLTKLVDLLEAEGLRDRYLLIAGGPRLSNTFAKELGYDAGFGPGSTPSQVAAWVATELIQRKGE